MQFALAGIALRMRTTNLVNVIGNSADVIEEGRRPNSTPPPVAAIEKWMREKPVKLRGPKGGFIKTTPQGLKNAAYSIARAIGKRGIVSYYHSIIVKIIEIVKIQPLLQTELGVMIVIIVCVLTNTCRC